MRSPVVELLADLAAAPDPAGLPWYLFGAQAAILHGSARLTADVDVTVRLPDDRPHCPAMPLRTKESYSVDRSGLLAAIKHRLLKTHGRPLRGVLLYGSEVRGEAGPDSDIDILVLLD